MSISNLLRTCRSSQIEKDAFHELKESAPGLAEKIDSFANKRHRFEEANLKSLQSRVNRIHATRSTASSKGSVPRSDFPLLKQIPLFKSLTAEQSESMYARMKLQTFEKGDAVCVEGEEGHDMFIISSGALDIQITDNSGHPKTLTLHRGKCFGEIALTDPNCKRTATVSAASGPDDDVGPVNLICVSRSMFEEIKAQKDESQSALEAWDLYDSGRDYLHGTKSTPTEAGGASGATAADSAALDAINQRLHRIEVESERTKESLEQRIDGLGGSMRSLEETTTKTQQMLQDLIRHSVMSVRRAAKTPERQRRNP